jgi:hypothetical protein
MRGTLRWARADLRARRGQAMITVAVVAGVVLAGTWRAANAGFIGLVDESRGMHRATEKKGVTVSFFTKDIDGWFAYVKNHQTFALRSDAVHPDPDGRFRAFVGYDPEGYFLEFDVFLDHSQNKGFITLLGR